MMRIDNISFRFLIGMILLIINVPVGLLGLGFGAFMAKRTGKKIYYPVGTGIYIASWVMLGAGVWMTGEQGLLIVKAYNLRHPWIKFAAPLVISGIIIYAIINGIRKRSRKNSGSQPS